MRLAGKTAIITGAGAGIGRACAVLFAAEGAKVVIAEQNVKTGTAALIEVQAAGGEAIFVPTDVSQEESVQALVQTALDTYGRIDILYNNVGGSTKNDGPIHEVSNDEFWLKMNVDLFGTWLGCRHVIPYMIEQGGGAIVNATSITALVGTKNKAAYTCAKGAIISLTQQMAVEYAGNGIRVNAVAPAGTLTERVSARMAVDTGDQRTSLKASDHLLGLSGSKDIAYAVLYLASDEAKTTTGIVLRVDSGVAIS